MKTLLFKFSCLIMTSFMLLEFTGCKEEEAIPPKEPIAEEIPKVAEPLPTELTTAEKPLCRTTKSYVYVRDIISTTTFEYDSEDRLIAQKGISTSGTGESGYTKSFEYNLRGQVIRHTSKSYYKEGTQQGSADWSTFFEYDQKGQVIKLEEVRVNTQTGKETRFTYTQEYDSEGNRTKVSRLYGDSAAVVSLYEYKDGDCVKAITNMGSNFERVTEYEYYLDRENKKQAEQATIWGYGHSAEKHMLKKETATPKDESQSGYYNEYSYEYNDQGFVVKSIIDPAGGEQYVTTIINEYVCQ